MVQVDPNIILNQGMLQNIVSGFAVEGIKWVWHILRKKDTELLDSEKYIRSALKKDGGFKDAIAIAVTSIANFNTDHDIKALHHFLFSPEVENIVRQIYAYEFQEKTSVNALPSIKAEFAKLMAAHLQTSEFETGDVSDRILCTLIVSCEKAIEICCNEGLIERHEIQSAARHEILLSELELIHTQLSILKSPQLDVQKILAYAQKYCKAVEEKHGYIIPQNPNDHRKKFPIDELYVANSFRQYYDPVSISATGESAEDMEDCKFSDEVIELINSCDVTEDSTEVTLEIFDSSIYRTVLLGDPGGGKSTTTARIAYDHAKRYFNESTLLPIVVVLRKYAADKKERNWSILDFIKATTKSVYQLNDAPAYTFEYLLSSGRVLVIFDGLDELTNTNDRSEIRDDVSLFGKNYSSSSILVTSRKIGYEQAPLNETIYTKYTLDSFNDKQVAEYVKKWFNANMPESPAKRAGLTKTFLQESKVAPDLRSNPLMLGLMCNIYRRQHYIPKNKPDIYEQCTRLLFMHWDVSRGIDVPYDFEKRLFDILAYLAFWIYSSDLNEGVTEKLLIKKTKEYEIEKRGDSEKAASIAQIIIDYCKGRAWVFTDIGATKDQSLYAFTHRTFLEYFAAVYLVKKNHTPELLANALLPHIEIEEWDVVAQLAYHMLYNDIDDNLPLFRNLLDKASNSNAHTSLTVLSFAVRLLESVEPHPTIIESIARECIIACIKSQLYDNKCSTHPSFWQSGNKRRALVTSLMHLDLEDKKIVSSTIIPILASKIRDDDVTTALLSLEIAFELEPLTYNSPGSIDVWHDSIENLISQNKDRITEFSSKSLIIAINAYYRMIISISNLIDAFGIEVLLEMPLSRMFDHSYPSLLVRLLGSATFGWNLAAESVKYDISSLKTIGEIFLASKKLHLDQIHFDKVTQHQFNLLIQNLVLYGVNVEYEMDGDAFFGAFCLLAAFVGDEAKRVASLNKSCRVKNDLVEITTLAFRTRIDFENLPKLRNRLSKINLSSDQAMFINRWATNELCF